MDAASAHQTPYIYIFPTQVKVTHHFDQFCNLNLHSQMLFRCHVDDG